MSNPPPPLPPLQTEIAYVRLPATDVPHSLWVTRLAPVALASWSRPRFSVSVITNDRPGSLQRLLDSLQRSRLYGDQVHCFVLPLCVGWSFRADFVRLLDCRTIVWCGPSLCTWNRQVGFWCGRVGGIGHDLLVAEACFLVRAFAACLAGL